MRTKYERYKDMADINLFPAARKARTELHKSGVRMFYCHTHKLWESGLEFWLVKVGEVELSETATCSYADSQNWADDYWTGQKNFFEKSGGRIIL